MVDAPRSPQLQGREAGKRQHHRDDPEPDHDLRLGPAQLLEMVMDRRHPEDTFAGELERYHLHDHRDGFEHEQAADHRQHDLVLAVIGGLFVLEAVSVIVQVASFKLTGKRVFRMAPLHHHFEQKGWTEPQIVIRFWIISVMLALAGLSTLKLR